MHDIYQWWKIAPYNYIKDKQFKDKLYDEGYYLGDKLDDTTVQQLEKLYVDNHNFQDSGMFNTMYSQDVAYRKKIHKEITHILDEYLANTYQDFKVVYSVFFLKGPRTKEFLYLHQDLTMVDEAKYSAIHLWVPLTDITVENGALCIIDKTHHLYAPYRGMSIPAPTHLIQEHLTTYLKPVTVKKGQVLAFDPRTIHCSLPNKTKQSRPVVIAVLTPKEAKIEVSYQDPKSEKIEVIEQAEDFFITSHHFIETSKERPPTGTSAGFVDYQPHYYKVEEFDQLAAKFNIAKKNIISKLGDMNTQIHRNPMAKRKNLLTKWFRQ